ncbi:hypothetical protein BH23PLA1_BH23PLA1_44370 [soil metagenome]
MRSLTNWLLAFVVALLFVNATRGDFVLQFVDPENSGVVVMDSRGGGHVLTNFRADADPIRLASARAVQASLDAGGGPERTFAFAIDGGGHGFLAARTATRTQLAGAPITLQILGTAGEVGPVELLVSSLYAEEVPPDAVGFSRSIRIDGAAIPVPVGASGFASFGFNVGDTFQLDVSLDRILAAPGQLSSPPGTATLTTSLRLVPVPVPAPSALATATIGLFALAGFGIRRRRAIARRGESAWA